MGRNPLLHYGGCKLTRTVPLYNSCKQADDEALQSLAAMESSRLVATQAEWNNWVMQATVEAREKRLAELGTIWGRERSLVPARADLGPAWALGLASHVGLLGPARAMGLGDRAVSPSCLSPSGGPCPCGGPCTSAEMDFWPSGLLDPSVPGPLLDSHVDSAICKIS